MSDRPSYSPDRKPGPAGAARMTQIPDTPDGASGGDLISWDAVETALDALEALMKAAAEQGEPADAFALGMAAGGISAARAALRALPAASYFPTEAEGALIRIREIMAGEGCSAEAVMQMEALLIALPVAPVAGEAEAEFLREAHSKLQDAFTRVISERDAAEARVAEAEADRDTALVLVREIVRGVWSRCEALEDEATSKLNGANLNEHERGFWSGQSMTAKSLRRSTVMPEGRTAALSQPASAGVTGAARDVRAERQRQISDEGWSAENDDSHQGRELAAAAACYAMFAVDGVYGEGDGRTPPNWPWATKWWKPTTPRRALVKAGALILAEIERLDRGAPSSGSKEVDLRFTGEMLELGGFRRTASPVSGPAMSIHAGQRGEAGK